MLQGTSFSPRNRWVMMMRESHTATASGRNPISRVAARWGYLAASEVILEKNEDMKRRGLPSSDYADALCLTFAASVQKLQPDYLDPENFGASRWNMTVTPSSSAASDMIDGTCRNHRTSDLLGKMPGHPGLTKFMRGMCLVCSAASRRPHLGWAEAAGLGDFGDAVFDEPGRVVVA